MTDEGRWSGGYIVLSGNVRVGSGGMSGTGIGSLPPAGRAQVELLLAAIELRQAISQTPFVRRLNHPAISQTSAMTMTLQAIEVHEAGCLGTLHCQAEPGLGMGTGHSGFIAAMEIGDERGTSYEVQSGLWRFNGASGAAEFYVRPRPAEGAGKLTITVARLVPWQSPGGPLQPQGPFGTTIEGPWVLEVIV